MQERETRIVFNFRMALGENINFFCYWLACYTESFLFFLKLDITNYTQRTKISFKKNWQIFAISFSSNHLTYGLEIQLVSRKLSKRCKGEEAEKQLNMNKRTWHRKRKIYWNVRQDILNNVTISLSAFSGQKKALPQTILWGIEDWDILVLFAHCLRLTMAILLTDEVMKFSRASLHSLVNLIYKTSNEKIREQYKAWWQPKD